MDTSLTPLVTIVTPSFNQGRYIRATIESVLRQDYPRLEYVIMDGGSTDETASIVREYASRLVFISEKDRGQSHAINKGFRMARGEIVSWLNSDDVLLDGAVSRAVGAFLDHPSAAAIYGEGYRIDQDGRIKDRFPHTEPFNLWKLVYLSDYILQQSAFFRRSVFQQVGWIDEDLEYAMDWDLFVRIGKRYGLVYVPEYLGCIREYPDAKSATGGKRRVREIARVLRRQTGTYLPPGLIVYGLETYRQLWCEAVRRRTPSFLTWPSRKLESLILAATGYCIEGAIHHSQGWYRDGWAGPKLRYMLPPGRGQILIEGTLPDSPELAGQSLTMRLNTTRAGVFPLPAGDFQIALPPPPDPDAPVLLELRASRHFVPAQDGESRHRRLAYQFRRVAWSG